MASSVHVAVAIALVVLLSLAGSSYAARPPVLKTSTSTGVVSTGSAAGLLNQLPFTLRMDPGRERFRLDLVYYFQTITVMQYNDELYVKVGEECESDSTDEYLLPSDLFSSSTFLGTRTRSSLARSHRPLD